MRSAVWPLIASRRHFICVNWCLSSFIMTTSTTVGFNSSCIMISSRPLGFEFLHACISWKQTMDLLWLNTWLYVIGYGIRDPQFETLRIEIIINWPETSTPSYSRTGYDRMHSTITVCRSAGGSNVRSMSKLRIAESRCLGNSLCTWEFHPFSMNKMLDSNPTLLYSTLLYSTLLYCTILVYYIVIYGTML